MTTHLLDDSPSGTMAAMTVLPSAFRHSSYGRKVDKLSTITKQVSKQSIHPRA